MHLGPTEGRVAKSKKQSTKRWEQLQEVNVSMSLANVCMGLAELGAHQDKHEATLAWVSAP